MLHSNYIPTKHLNHFVYAKAQIIPEQRIFDTVKLYEASIPYIKCQLRSTMQHEGGHRRDEENRNKQIIDKNKNPNSHVNIMPFEEFANENRAEPIAEKEEENCNALSPSMSSGNIIDVNLNDLFEQAKAEADIDPIYKSSIKAGTLATNAQGMYLMQNLNDIVSVKAGTKPNHYEGFDGSLYVDVRKIVDPFIVNNSNSSNGLNQPAKPATYQDDGIEPDVQNITVQNNQSGAGGASQSVQSIQSVPSIGAI